MHARLAQLAMAIQLLCGAVTSCYGDSSYVGSKVSLQTDSNIVCVCWLYRHIGRTMAHVAWSRNRRALVFMDTSARVRKHQCSPASRSCHVCHCCATVSVKPAQLALMIRLRIKFTSRVCERRPYTLVAIIRSSCCTHFMLNLVST